MILNRWAGVTLRRYAALLLKLRRPHSSLVSISCNLDLQPPEQPFRAGPLAEILQIDAQPKPAQGHFEV